MLGLGTHVRFAAPMMGHGAMMVERTCVGCRNVDSRDNLVRLVATEDGVVAFDLAGKSFGRGAWVHPRAECLLKSVRNLGRTLKAQVEIRPNDLQAALVLAAERRVRGLLNGANGAGQLRIGADCASEAYGEKRIELVLLAEDAKAGARLPWLQEVISSGRAMWVRSKLALGEWLGTGEIAVLAITDPRLAKAVARTLAIAQIPFPVRENRVSDKGTEVG